MALKSLLQYIVRNLWTRALLLSLSLAFLLVFLKSEALSQAAPQGPLSPTNPDEIAAFPTLAGMSCEWGWSDCSPCANNVEASFATLRTHGDLMGFNLGDHPDPSGVFENHWQGVQRLPTGDGRTMIVTRDHVRNPDTGKLESAFAVVSMGSQFGDGDRFHLNRLNWLFYNDFVGPPAADRISATEYISQQYAHPGGIQVAGSILAVGTGNAIHFYYIDEQDPLNPLKLDVPFPPRPDRTGSSVSITMLVDGRYLVIVADSDAQVLDFYISNQVNDFDLSEGFSWFDEWYPSELVGFRWEAFQSINLVTECTTGQLYLVGTGNSGPFGFRELGHDWAFLFRLDKEPGQEHVQIATTGLAAHKYCSYGTQTQCNFDAAAGVYVDPDHQLHLYATEHWNDGPAGSIKMMQFRSQLADTCSSTSEAWVELFEHDTFRGRSLLIDYLDRDKENYYNYDHAEDFEDEASSVRWCLPEGLTFSLYVDKDPCRGQYNLTGSGSMRQIANLHKIGYGDRFSCSEFHMEVPASFWIDPSTGGVFAYNYTLPPGGQALIAANPSITVDVPPYAVADPVTLEIVPASPPEHDPSPYVSPGYAFDLNAYDDQTPLPEMPFDLPVEITVVYDQADLGDVSEDTLGLFVWDGVASQWLPAQDTCLSPTPPTHDTAQDWLQVSVCRIGAYAMLGMLPPQPPLKVLFDEAHDERNTLDWDRAVELSQSLPWHPEPDWIYFGLLQEVLSDTVDFDRHVAGPLNDDLLASYDVLVLSVPESAFTGDEVYAIRRFVTLGGGLVMLGDCASYFPNPSLSGVYGISFDPYCLFEMNDPGEELDADMEITTYAYHPAANDVSQYVTNWGRSVSISGKAQWLADTYGVDAWRDDNDDGIYQEGEEGVFPIGATYDQGCGRVIVFGDNAFQDAYTGQGNDVLMRSMLDWAAGGQPCELGGVYLPVVRR